MTPEDQPASKTCFIPRVSSWLIGFCHLLFGSHPFFMCMWSGSRRGHNSGVFSYKNTNKSGIWPFPPHTCCGNLTAFLSGLLLIATWAKTSACEWVGKEDIHFNSQRNGVCSPVWWHMAIIESQHLVHQSSLFLPSMN